MHKRRKREEKSKENTACHTRTAQHTRRTVPHTLKTSSNKTRREDQRRYCMPHEDSTHAEPPHTHSKHAHTLPCSTWRATLLLRHRRSLDVILFQHHNRSTTRHLLLVMRSPCSRGTYFCNARIHRSGGISRSPALRLSHHMRRSQWTHRRPVHLYASCP